MKIIRLAAFVTLWIVATTLPSRAQHSDMQGMEMPMKESSKRRTPATASRSARARSGIVAEPDRG